MVSKLEGSREIAVAKPHGSKEIAVPTSVPLNRRGRFRALANGEPITLLLDTGSTAMVVSENLVKHMRLPTERSPMMRFTFANGDTKKVTHTTRMSVTCGSYRRELQFYVAAISEEMILGIPWLESVDVCRFDWAQNLLKFQSKDDLSNHTWDLDRQPRDAMVHDLECIEFEEDLVELHQVSLNEITNETSDPEVARLLVQYKAVFQKPTALPPNRPETHEINIVSDSRMPSQRPLGRCPNVPPLNASQATKKHPT